MNDITPAQDLRSPAALAPAPGHTPPYALASESFRELVFVLRRRKYLMLGVTAIIMVVAYVVVGRLTPLYTSSAIVTIDPRRMQVVNIENVLSGLRSDEEAIQTEVQVLQSNNILRKTVRELRLFDDPEFNSRLGPPPLSPGERLRHLPELVRGFDWHTLLSGTAAETPPIAAPDTQDTEHAGAPPWTSAGSPPDPKLELELIASLRQRLHVDPIGRSRAIEIEFTSESALTAEKVANKIADLYLIQQLDAEARASKRAGEWLEERIAQLHTEVETAERRVETFRSETAAKVGMAGDDVAEQIKGLDAELVRARNEYELQRSRLRNIEEAVRTKGPTAAGRLLDSDLIHALESQEAALVSTGAQLSERYGPLHPLVVKNKAEQASVVAQISKELTNALTTQRNQVGVLGGRVASLEKDLEDLRSRATTIQQSDVTQRALQRDAEAKRNVLEAFLGRAKQLEQMGLQEPDARILSEAVFPLSPSFPRKRYLLGVALACALGIAVACAAAAEMLERGLKSREEVEHHLLVPAIGVLPRVRTGRFRRARPYDEVVESPVSAYSESLRGIMASLSLVGRPHRTAMLLVTSTVPKEGKSALVVSLARALACFGHRVLVIDCDLRRPQTHRYFGLSNSLGVADLASHADALEEIVQIDPRSGAHLLAAGRPKRGQEQILLGKATELLQWLQREGKYDCVLVDAPPVLAVSDARLVAPYVNCCVYVVRWRKTSRQAAYRGLRLLEQGGAQVAGVILSGVDPTVHRKYGICDEGHYPGSRYYYAKRA